MVSEFNQAQPPHHRHHVEPTHKLPPHVVISSPTVDDTPSSPLAEKYSHAAPPATQNSIIVNVLLPAMHILIWFFFNVSTVILNKYLYKEYKFNYAFSLTIIHMFVGFIGSLSVLKLLPKITGKELIKFKPLPSLVWRNSIVPLSALFCVNIILGNVSLQYVPVSFMQTVKSSVPAINVLLAVSFFKQHFSWRIHLTVLLVVLGVGSSTIAEANFHWGGFLCALIASFTTAIQAILAGKMLSGENRLDSLNLVYYMSPLSCILLLPFCIILESNSIVKEWEYFGNANATLVLVVSGLIAFGLNVSSFLVVKHTSPLTFNIAGNFKVVLSIIISVAIFKNEINVVNAIGCGVAVVGTFLYNFFRTQENFAEATKPPPSNKV